MKPSPETTLRLRFLDENNEPYPEWEEKKLGDVSSKVSNNLLLSQVKESGSYRVYGASGLVGYIDKNQYEDKEMFFLVKDGAGAGKTIMPLRESTFISTLQGIEAKEDNSLGFLYALYNHLNLAATYVGTTIPHIYFKDYSQTKFLSPSLPEQEKIGEFLSALDAEVEQAERLVSLLSDRKRAYAQGIFNRTLRFHDDNGNPYPEWEEKKLGEVGEWKPNSGFAKKHINPEGENSLILYGELYTRYDGKSHISKIDSRTSEISTRSISPGDLLFPSSGETKSQIIRCLTVSRKNDTPIYTSGDLLILSPSTEFSPYSLFISSYINSPSLNREMRTKAQGNSVVHMSKGAWENCSIPIPSIPEQEKIGSFLSALDDEIDEAKRELELLKERKKAYAQRIFGV